MESMARPGTVLADLRAEADDLDRVVADLDDKAWATPTPSPGWTIARQIAHLDWTDERAPIAVTEIVTNAGGVNPAGLAARLRGLAGRLGLDARVAYFEGDGLTRRAGGSEAAWRLLAHTQAKAVGEWLRSRHIDIPAVLL